MLRPELAETLAFVHRLAERANVVPILFGTAVLELKGIGAFCAADLDIIVDEAEARALAAVAGFDLGRESGNDRFRSKVHLHLTGAPLVIDVMAGMSVRMADGWRLYDVLETAEIEVDGRRFRTASLDDLQRFYRLAGRAKDGAKIAAIEAILA